MHSIGGLVTRNDATRPLRSEFMISYTNDFLKVLQESFRFDEDLSWATVDSPKRRLQTIDEYIDSISTLGELERFWRLSINYVDYAVYDKTSRSFFGSIIKVIDRLLLSIGLDAGLIETLRVNYGVYVSSGKQSCDLVLSQLDAVQSIASYEESVLILQITSLVLEVRRELGV